jgi:hypothetical protein
MQDKVDIRPGVGILSVLQSVNYRAWYALAEFVDNAIQSYKCDFEKIKRLNSNYRNLKVVIELDPSDEGVIVIRDNAGTYPIQWTVS